MKRIALFGAGGKMGIRCARNLMKSDFEIAPVEISPQGQDRFREATGLDCLSEDAALAQADVVLLAVPDTAIRAVSHAIVNRMKSGAMLVCLDAAGPHAGHLPDRADVTYFVTHPCHPPIFNDEMTPEGRNDHFGGIHAQQGVVNALMQGPEEDYALGDAVARAIYAPVARSHRVTVAQMALLEPGLSETVCATLMAVLREAMDEVVARGVPEAAAKDFLLGHMNILAAVTFDKVDGVFSDACYMAMKHARPALMQEDWKRVLAPEEVLRSVQRIT